MVCLVLIAAPLEGAIFAYTNSASISIPLVGNATPNYPSKIVVSDVPGQIASFTVTLRGYSQNLTGSIDVALVSPSGTAVMLFGRVAGSVNNVNLTFADNGSAFPTGTLPPTINSGTYRPTDAGPARSMPSPGPTSWVTTLSSFHGQSANGEWKLFVHNSGGSSGTIANGWSINFTTVPEPGEYAMIAGLGLLGFGCWRCLQTRRTAIGDEVRVGRMAAARRIRNC